jgi:outer membrane lipoprotein SlyB
MKNVLLAAALVVTMICSGCASIQSEDYRFGQARAVASETAFGRVLEVRPVKVTGRPGATGAGIGALIGGMAAGFGSGSGGIGAAGAVIGAIVGAGAEAASTTQPGVEATIALDNGKIITVVQGANEQFHPGDRVKLIAFNRADGTVEVRFTHSTVPQKPSTNRSVAY